MDKPNLALVVLDAFRYDHLWRRAVDGPLCPHIGRFAESAVSFENAISPATMTGPTHTSFFTGRLPIDHGMFSIEHLLAGELPRPHLLDELHAAGYLCVGLSGNPWISRCTALGRGFDLLIHADELRHRAGRPSPWRYLARGAARLVRGAARPPDVAPLLGTTKRMTGALASSLTAVRRAWPERPVFVFVNLMATHDPYLFEPEDAEAARPPGLGGRAPVPQRLQPSFWLDTLGVRPITDEALARLRWAYAASVRFADRMAGRLIDAIDRCLRPDGTDVILTSDHGELLGEHGFFDHGLFLYEPLVHVPLLVRSAARPGPEQVERTVQTHWIWRLIMDRARCEVADEGPPGMGNLLDEGPGDGSPARSFADPDAHMRRLRVMLTAAAREGVDADAVRPKPLDAHLQAVRVGGEALIRTCAGRDLALRVADGTEQTLTGKEAEDVVRRLGPSLSDTDWTAARRAGGPEPPDGDVIRRLRDLGYAD